jgi:hypothetical protein
MSATGRSAAMAASFQAGRSERCLERFADARLAAPPEIA